MQSTSFFGHEISRLIVGDNPFTGHSYIEHKITGKEMKAYYDSKRLYEVLFKIEEAGYTCMMPLAHPFNVQIIREYKRDGGKLQFIFQPYEAMDQRVMMRELDDIEPIGIYHQGTNADMYFEIGRCDEIRRQIAEYHTMGIPVGLGTHRPEVIELAEKEGWDVNFYVACLQNARRGRAGEASGFLTGKTKQGLVFYPEDRPIMLDMISKVQKPCIAFKIFAGGQLLLAEDPEEVKECIRNVYREVFSKLKPSDVAAIGVFNKYHDQISEDAALFEEVMQEMASGMK